MDQTTDTRAVTIPAKQKIFVAENELNDFGATSKKIQSVKQPIKNENQCLATTMEDKEYSIEDPLKSIGFN